MSFAVRAAGPDAGQLERAARTLWIRARREAASVLAGGYRSSVRGGGSEFEESRPYEPGDDVRSIDWNATARTGTPYVKRFREERDQTLLLALDTSASMAFAGPGRSKAAAAAHCAALLAAAALHVGDRVGLVGFDVAPRVLLPPGRGDAHALRLMRALLASPPPTRGETSFAAALAGIRERFRRRAVLFLLSDFRDDGLLASARTPHGARTELAIAARRHDVFAVALSDPHEHELPASGSLRLVDPERPARSWLLRGGDAQARERYRAAALARERLLVRRLRSDGAAVIVLRSDTDPLRVLGRHFGVRVARRGARR